MIEERVLSTTDVDRHGEKMSKEHLNVMMNAINSYVMPMSFNHDPRFPPLGRISDARIVERSDGEYELIGTIETYEEKN